MSSNTASFTNHPQPIHQGITPANYDDIINLKRPIAPNHPPMSRSNRAAQFAPFAALSGYQKIVAAAEQDSTFTGNIIIPNEDYTDLPPAIDTEAPIEPQEYFE